MELGILRITVQSRMDQSNADGDALGDACDDDDDNDGFFDYEDELPLDSSDHKDLDGDGVGDKNDNCPSIFNSTQLNNDDDSLGDACDDDDDGDGVDDLKDVFPFDASEQRDSDGDGIEHAFPDNAGVQGYQYLQTSSASQNVTSLNILNTSDKTQTFRAVLFDSQGNRGILCSWGGCASWENFNIGRFRKIFDVPPGQARPSSS